jgi:hypothetical protein
MARRPSRPKEPSSAPQTESEEPTRVATRSKNKNVHPGKEAGVVRRTREEIQAEKAAKTAAREEAQAEKGKKEAAAIERVAAIERQQEATYALDETPRCDPQKKVSHSTGSKPPQSPATSDLDQPSESGSSSVDFVPGDETTEDGEVTEGTATTDQVTEGTATTDHNTPKKRRKGKGPRRRKEKQPIRKKIGAVKEAMGEYSLETPRPASKRANILSVSTHS